MNESPHQTCSHVRRDGRPCRGTPLPGKTACIFHDPDSAARREAGRRAGGQTRSRKRATVPETVPDLPLTSMAEVAALLAISINQTRKGLLDAKIANTVGALANVLVRTLQQADIEKRLAAIEEELAAAKSKRTTT